MSLINKMLQDLDARGGAQGAGGMPATIKPVVRAERNMVPIILGGLLAVIAIATAGWYFGRMLKNPEPIAIAPAPRAVTKAVVPSAPPPPPPVVVVEEKPVEAAPVVEAPKPAPVPKKKKHAAEKKEKAKKAVKAAKVVAEKPAAAKPVTGKPQAEAQYRRALAALEEGRNGEAIAGLEQTLETDPRHDAARQTLIGLLIENKRPDEAMRVLQQGLQLDPRQPALAMLLARMQIERGTSGIDTLLRTLPFAGSNAEYRAFLAAALQREQRHREAIEQYQAAVQASPQSGVWLMGLGISLQAEKRNAEAIDAFRKANATGTLSAELQAFVARRIQQLTR